jgi:hypothetical protein
MHPPPRSRHPLRFALALAALAVPAVPAVLGALACLGPDQSVIWFCLNPVNGKLDGTFYDSSHYVNGVFDPCHCYDPCGPWTSCPIEVEAGPPPLGCDAGTRDAGTGTGGAGGGG